MLLTAIFLGAALVVGVAAFWKDIVDWLKRAVNKVKSIVRGIHYGFKVFVRKISEGMKEISKHYSKNGTQWEETVVTKKISESEVPEDIREIASYNNETDITEKLEMELA